MQTERDITSLQFWQREGKSVLFRQLTRSRIWGIPFHAENRNHGMDTPRPKLVIAHHMDNYSGEFHYWIDAHLCVPAFSGTSFANRFRHLTFLRKCPRPGFCEKSPLDTSNRMMVSGLLLHVDSSLIFLSDWTNTVLSSFRCLRRFPVVLVRVLRGVAPVLFAMPEHWSSRAAFAPMFV